MLEKGIEVNNLFVIDSYPVSGKVEDEFIDEVIFLPNYQLMLSEVLEDVDDFKVIKKLELYYHQVHIQDYQKLYLSMWQKYIKELRYLSKNTFMEIVIFRMELHKM